MTTYAAPERLNASWLEVKAAPAADSDHRGFFSGYLAVFNNTDKNDDIILPGAFRKSLDEAKQALSGRKATRDGFGGRTCLYPLLWQHNRELPIGGFTEMKEDSKGLYVEGFYDLDIELGRHAYSAAKKGYMPGLSIGYRAIKASYKGNTRLLHEVKLLEGSQVTFACNEKANVTEVKGKRVETDPFLVALAEAIARLEVKQLAAAADREAALERKRATGSTSFPLAPRDHPWDKGAANQRLQAWAKAGDGVDMQKWASVHFYSPTGPDAADISKYKFPFCDVVDGEAKAVPDALHAAASRLPGSSIPDADKAAVRGKLAVYAKKLRDGDEPTPTAAKTEPEPTAQTTTPPAEAKASAEPEPATDATTREDDTTERQLAGSLLTTMLFDTLTR